MAEQGTRVKGNSPRLNKKYERELTFICSYMAEMTNLSGLRIDDETDYFTSIQKLVEQNVSSLSSSLDDFFSLAVADPKYYEKSVTQARLRSPKSEGFKTYTGNKPFAQFIKQAYGDDFMRSIPEMSRKRRQLILSGESILDVDDKDLRKVLQSLTVTDRRDIGRYLKYKILYLDRTIFTTELNFRRYGVELELYKAEMATLREKGVFSPANKAESKKRMFGLADDEVGSEVAVNRMQNYLTYGGEVDQLITIIEKLTAEKERFEGYLERLTWKYLKGYEAKVARQQADAKRKFFKENKGWENVDGLTEDQLSVLELSIKKSELEDALIDDDTRREEQELDEFINQLYSIKLDEINDVDDMQMLVNQLVPDEFHGLFDAFYTKDQGTGASDDPLTMDKNNLQYLKDSFKRWLTWIDPTAWVNVTLNTLRVIEHSDMYDGLFKAVLAQELSFDQKRKLALSQQDYIVRNQAVAAKPKPQRVIVKPAGLNKYSRTASGTGNNAVVYYTSTGNGIRYVLQSTLKDGTLILEEDVTSSALAADAQLEDIIGSMEVYKPDDIYKFGVSALVIIRQAIDECFFSKDIDPKKVVSNYLTLIQAYVDAEIQTELYGLINLPPYDDKTVDAIEIEEFQLPFITSIEDNIHEIKQRYRPYQHVDNKELVDYYTQNQKLIDETTDEGFANAEDLVNRYNAGDPLSPSLSAELDISRILVKYKQLKDKNDSDRSELERRSEARRQENEAYAELVEAKYPDQVKDAIQAFGREQIEKIEAFEKKYLMKIPSAMYPIYTYNDNLSPMDNVDALKKHYQEINQALRKAWGAEIAKFRRAYEQQTKRQLKDYERKYLQRGIVLDLPEYEYDSSKSPSENRRLKEEFDASTNMLVTAYEQWLTEIKELIPYSKAEAIAKNKQFIGLTKAVEACLYEVVFSSANALGYNVQSGRGERL